MSLDWLNDIVQGLIKCFPIPVIVRATHCGVKWVLGKNVKKMEPGFHIVWPLITEHAVIVTARQTNNLPNQALVTKDGKQIVAGGLVIYSIYDVELAIGSRNWDYSQTVTDLAQAVIVGVITKWNYEELLNKLTTSVEKQMTNECKRQLKEFGIEVERCALTDFAPARVIKLLGAENPDKYTS